MLGEQAQSDGYPRSAQEVLEGRESPEEALTHGGTMQWNHKGRAQKIMARALVALTTSAHMNGARKSGANARPLTHSFERPGWNQRANSLLVNRCNKTSHHQHGPGCAACKAGKYTGPASQRAHEPLGLLSKTSHEGILDDAAGPRRGGDLLRRSSEQQDRAEAGRQTGQK